MCGWALCFCLFVFLQDELRREHDEWDRVANVSATVREAKFQGVAANSGRWPFVLVAAEATELDEC